VVDEARKEQCRKSSRKWKREHPEQHAEDCSRWRKQNPARQLLIRLRTRARVRGLAFSITLEDILPLPSHCPILGVELRSGKYPNDPHAYSVDRIDSSKGYIPGNVAVISSRANRIKNDGSAEEHERIAAWMRDQNGG